MQYLSKEKGGRGGCVINIGSSASVRPQISTPIYTATKHALLGLTRSCGVNNLFYLFVFFNFIIT